MSNFYRFHALDVATYIKWAHLNKQMESNVIGHLWEIRESCLVFDGCEDYADFENQVFYELHQLWSRSFVDEHSDLLNALDEERYPIKIIRKNYARVELRYKLLTLHFILTPQLPYVRLDLGEDLLNLGYKRCAKTLAESILKLVETLGLSMVKANGFPCDSEYLQDSSYVLVGLSAQRVSQIKTKKTGESQKTAGGSPRTAKDADGEKETVWRPKYEPKTVHKRPVSLDALDSRHGAHQKGAEDMTVPES